MAGAAATALAVGIGVAGATQAQAADNFAKLSAPMQVTSGQDFKLVCQLPKGSGYSSWKDFTAKVKEKGAVIQASRKIGSNGNCSMNLDLDSLGSHQLRVLAIGGNNILKSQWITVTVVT